VTFDEFLQRCPTLWHVGPVGSWEGIKKRGFRTAEQLIGMADLEASNRTELLTEPRADTVTLSVEGDTVTLRDQQSLLKRKDPGSPMGDGISVADWVQILNRRVYLFTDEVAMRKFLAKSVERDGAQEVITFSPRRLVEACRPQIELSVRNSGSVARTAGPQTQRNTFVSIALFPGSKRPSEITVVDGIDDLSVVAFVETRHRDGTKVAVPR